MTMVNLNWLAGARSWPR